jgi:hypothetical protein
MGRLIKCAVHPWQVASTPGNMDAAGSVHIHLSFKEIAIHSGAHLANASEPQASWLLIHSILRISGKHQINAGEGL